MIGLINRLPYLTHIHNEVFEQDGPFEETARKFASDPGTVLLLSGTDLDCARYHILAVDPWMSIRGKGSRIEITCREEKFLVESDPLAALESLLDHFRWPYSEHLLPVSSGWFGYLAYDLKNSIEKLPQTCMDKGLPDICLYAPSVILVHDRKTWKTHLSIPVLESGKTGAENASQVIEQKKKWFFEKLSCPVREGTFSTDTRGLQSSFTKPQYLDAVQRIIAYLKAGDIYQANLSQRFTAAFSGDAYSFFLKLFHKNPAPFFSFVNAGDHTIVSTSPERFIQQDNRAIETRPIKGTISREPDAAQDRRNAAQLLDSPKDDAELTMIVDLMRNDLSRVTCHGSVVVKEHKRLEPYDNVFHLVSVVTGELEENRSAIDLIRATFPGGSITGCPKIRSMEIIDELEPVRRHIYTGSIGYISFHNTLDLSIAIRTATIKDHRICFSVGGGIVYDSDPRKEYQETLDKGKTIMDVLSGTIAHGVPPSRHRTWVNGRLCFMDEAVLSAACPGFQYGAGLFETIRVEKGRALRLDAHINRLTASWKQLFKTDLPDITWPDVIALLIRENHLGSETAAVKIIAALDDPDTTGHNGPFLAVSARKYIHRLAADPGKKGLNLLTCPHRRHSHLADHKTLNYLYYHLAGRDAKERGADEALILNDDASISETNTASVFMVSENRVIVPLSDHVLPGVTLKAALEFLSGRGYEIILKKMFSSELTGSGAVILTNALMGAVPVISVDGIRLETDRRTAFTLCDHLNLFLSGGAVEMKLTKKSSLNS